MKARNEFMEHAEKIAEEIASQDGALSVERDMLGQDDGSEVLSAIVVKQKRDFNKQLRIKGNIQGFTVRGVGGDFARSGSWISSDPIEDVKDGIEWLVRQ